MLRLPDRRADLDWLRVSAFGLLILYHAGMAWSGWSWHLTSSDSIDWLREGMRFLNRWRMPLIFVVSGAADHAGAGHAFAGRLRPRPRAPPAGAAGLRHGRDGAAAGLSRAALPRPVPGSFLDWLPQAFAGVYPTGNMSWHHLWFLAYVLVLTFVLLPCFLWARSARGRAAHARAGVMRGANRPAVADAVAARRRDPVAGADLAQHQRPDRRLVRPRLLRRCCCSAAPSCSARRTCWPTLNRQRWLSLAIGVAAYAVLYVFFVDGAVRPVDSPTTTVRPTRSCRRSTPWPGCSPSWASPIAT